jgi:hypothetical protein
MLLQVADAAFSYRPGCIGGTGFHYMMQLPEARIAGQPFPEPGIDLLHDDGDFI